VKIAQRLSDIATVAGLVINVNGQIPRVGDVIDLPPLKITIVTANDYRVDLGRGDLANHVRIRRYSSQGCWSVSLN
jgi:Mg2+/Co2+ transporter CorC